jgi:CRISPR type I-E-associated protein CasB/Cse2
MNQEQDKIPESVRNFVGRLEQLDAGERARLKRNAGNTPDESRNALGLFYKELLRDRTLSEWTEDRYFLVATLYPFEKRPRQDPDQEPLPPPPNLGVSLRQVRTERNSEGLDRRFERLLDADEQQLPFLLRREIHFLTNEGGRVNWAQLLHDVLRWQHASRHVQRRWARDYFASQPTNEQTDENS